MHSGNNAECRADVASACIVVAGEKRGGLFGVGVARNAILRDNEAEHGS